MSNHYSNHHLPLLILALCAVHCILDLGALRGALYSGPCKEAARRAEKEAEERRQKEQEERS